MDIIISASAKGSYPLRTSAGVTSASSIIRCWLSICRKLLARRHGDGGLSFLLREPTPPWLCQWILTVSMLTIDFVMTTVSFITLSQFANDDVSTIPGPAHIMHTLTNLYDPPSFVRIISLTSGARMVDCYLFLRYRIVLSHHPQSLADIKTCRPPSLAIALLTPPPLSNLSAESVSHLLLEHFRIVPLFIVTIAQLPLSSCHRPAPPYYSLKSKAFTPPVLQAPA